MVPSDWFEEALVLTLTVCDRHIKDPRSPVLKYRIQVQVFRN